MTTTLPDISALPWPEGCPCFAFAPHKDGRKYAFAAMSLRDLHYVCLCAAEWFRVQAEAWCQYYLMDSAPEYTLHACKQYRDYTTLWEAAALQIERVMTETQS